MFETLEKASDGDIILVHGCCHNPSGVDLDEDWNNLTELLLRKNLLPFIDLAYQGLGDGLEKDVKEYQKTFINAYQRRLSLAPTRKILAYIEKGQVVYIP